MQTRDRRERLRELVSHIHPEPVELEKFQPGRRCLVAATAPVSQIRDFHEAVTHCWVATCIHYIGSATRIGELLDPLGISEDETLSLGEDGPFSLELLVRSGLEERICSYDTIVVLINNVAGIGYGNVLSAFFNFHLPEVYLWNIQGQILHWERERWKFAEVKTKELNELLESVYREMEGSR